MLSWHSLIGMVLSFHFELIKTLQNRVRLERFFLSSIDRRIDILHLRRWGFVTYQIESRLGRVSKQIDHDNLNEIRHLRRIV